MVAVDTARLISHLSKEWFCIIYCVLWIFFSFGFDGLLDAFCKWVFSYFLGNIPFWYVSFKSQPFHDILCHLFYTALFEQLNMVNFFYLHISLSLKRGVQDKEREREIGVGTGKCRVRVTERFKYLKVMKRKRKQL